MMDIKLIQTALKIPVTGVYDEFTESAVRNFQLKNNFPASGIVDNATLELLQTSQNDGLISTDLLENNPVIKQRFLSKGQYIDQKTKKRTIFLHFTAGWDNPFNVIADWERDKRGPIGTHFIIGGENAQTLTGKYDGEIVQVLPNYDVYAWHLGIGNVALHRESIGIEVCSFGPMTLKHGKFYNAYHKEVNSACVIDLGLDFRGYRYYQRFTELQLNAIKTLVLKLANELDIDVRKGTQEFLKVGDPFTAFDYNVNVHKDTIKEGLFLHTQVSPKNKYGNYEKWDCPPQPELVELIKQL
jgi:N-acetyl-anhydromuramyl-L-alanine amidase AmpD